MQKVTYFSTDLSVYANLAFEDYLLRKAIPQGKVEQALFLWPSQECIVIGRFQNPWAECHLPLMYRDKIPLVRRQSGGGTVYHGPGNLNFTFLTAKKHKNWCQNFNLIVETLKPWGIKAQVSGQHNLVVAGKKFSGSAFKETKDAVFHHGTLLVDADLTHLKKYLKPTRPPFAVDKSIKSNPASVVNLSQLCREITFSKLIDTLAKNFCDSPTQKISPSKQFDREIEEFASKLSKWDWVYGETPKFEDHFTLGDIDVEMVIHKGLIKKMSTLGHGDSSLNELSDALVGQKIGLFNETFNHSHFYWSFFKEFFDKNYPASGQLNS